MIKNLLKKIACSALGVSIALNAGCSKPITTKDYLIETENFKVRPFAKTYGDLKVSKPAREVSNVPENFRNVPIHHDDSDWGQGAAIPDDSAKVVPLIDYSFLKGGLETKIGDATLDVYGDLAVNLSYFIPISHDSWLGEVNERNYQGRGLGTERRGVGTALTYWTANYGPILIPGIKCDLALPINEDYEIIIGGGIRNYKLQTERGWDRYNSLDKRDTLKIADIKEKSIYLGIRGSNNQKEGITPTFKIGYNFYDFDMKEKGTIVDKKDKSFFVSFGGEYRF
jgi:hypothetical protein